MSSSIDLYSEISEANAKKKATLKRVNGVIAVLDEMSESDRTSLLQALADKRIDGTVIHEVLKKNGWNVSYDQIRRFRNGTCKVPDHYRAGE